MSGSSNSNSGTNQMAVPDLFSRRSDRQIDSRPGRRDARDLLRRVDKHVIAVIVAQNLNRLIILIAEILAAPLAQPVALVRTF